MSHRDLSSAQFASLSAGARENWPAEQRAAMDDFNQNHKMGVLKQFAETRQVGTHLFRGELRDPGDPKSVGMHWTGNPDAVVKAGAHRYEGTNQRPVIWHAKLEDQDATYSKDDPGIWDGKHRPADWETEVRYKPGAKVHVLGAYHPVEGAEQVWAPGHPDRMKGYTYRPIDKHVPVENKGYIHY